MIDKKNDLEGIEDTMDTVYKQRLEAVTKQANKSGPNKPLIIIMSILIALSLLATYATTRQNKKVQQKTTAANCEAAGRQRDAFVSILSRLTAPRELGPGATKEQLDFQKKANDEADKYRKETMLLLEGLVCDKLKKGDIQTIPVIESPPVPVGPSGVTGEKGALGLTGPQGPTGPPGPQGLTVQGPQGTPGQPGVSGSNGSSGQPGTNGANGIPGQNGLSGPEGPPGPQGPQGPEGPPASTTTIPASTTTTTSVPPPAFKRTIR